MLEAKDATIAIGGRTLFSGLSLMARDGMLTCITGPEGCGKTTLLRTLMGFLPVSEGFISVDGELLTIHSAHAFRQMMVYLPQEVRMLAHQLHEPEVPLCEADDMLVWSHALPAVEAEQQPEPLGAEAILQLAEQTIRQASDRSIIIADEPAANLSPELTGQLLVLLRQEAKAGKTVLLASRKPLVLMQADQVINLK